MKKLLAMIAVVLFTGTMLIEAGAQSTARGRSRGKAPAAKSVTKKAPVKKKAVKKPTKKCPAKKKAVKKPPVKKAGGSVIQGRQRPKSKK